MPHFIIKGVSVFLICMLGLCAFATAADEPKTSQISAEKVTGNVAVLKRRIAAKLPEMTVAQYTDCSIAATIMEQVGNSKGKPPVLRRSDVWDIAAQKRSNPKTVSLDELLEYPKLMKLLEAMSKDSKIPEGMKGEFVSISDNCNAEFAKALSGSSAK